MKKRKWNKPKQNSNAALSAANLFANFVEAKKMCANMRTRIPCYHRFILCRFFGKLCKDIDEINYVLKRKYVSRSLFSFHSPPCDELFSFSFFGRRNSSVLAIRFHLKYEYAHMRSFHIKRSGKKSFGTLTLSLVGRYIRPKKKEEKNSVTEFMGNG